MERAVRETKHDLRSLHEEKRVPPVVRIKESVIEKDVFGPDLEYK